MVMRMEWKGLGVMKGRRVSRKRRMGVRGVGGCIYLGGVWVEGFSVGWFFRFVRWDGDLCVAMLVRGKEEGGREGGRGRGCYIRYSLGGSPPFVAVNRVDLGFFTCSNQLQLVLPAIELHLSHEHPHYHHITGTPQPKP